MTLAEHRTATGTTMARRRRSLSDTAQYPLWFAIPAVAIMLALFVVPNALNFVFPFTDWSAFKSKINFVGLSTFADVFEDGTVVTALRSTILYAVLVAFFQNSFALALASLLERDTFVNRLCRALFFLPVLISPLAVGYVFQALLSTGGTLNRAIGLVLGHDVAIAWLGSTTWTIVVVTLIHTWKWVGLSMVVYIAGLKSVPEETLEAARLDGASRWQAFWQIKFPMIAPAITFNVATALIGALNTFDVVLATTKGGPADTTQVLNVYMFKIFGQGLFAQATVTSLFLFVVVVIVAVPLILFLRRREAIL